MLGVLMAVSASIVCGSQFTTTADGSYSAISCLFSSLSSSTNGGAILISSSSANFSAYLCLFSSCYASTDGGAIYMSVYRSSMNNSCGYSCNASVSGQFFYATTSSTGNFRQVAAAFCPFGISTAKYDSLYFNAGIQTVYFLNTSFNSVANDASGLIVYNSSSDVFSYLTIFSCYSSGQVVLHCSSSQTTFDRINFVNNSQGLTQNGLIYLSVSSNVTIKQSVFYGNNATQLFYINSGTITVSNSSIAALYTVGINGTAVVNCKYATASTYPFGSDAFSISGQTCLHQNSNVWPPSSLFSAAFVLRSSPLVQSIAVLLVNCL